MRIKQLAASALGSLMAGATLAMPAAAATLEDLPSPFIEEDTAEFSIVVGDDAATADVVGAIDIAVTMGGQPTLPIEIEEAIEVDGEIDEFTLRDNVDIGVTATEYPRLKRNYLYDEDDNLRVTEEIQVNSETEAAVMSDVDEEEFDAIPALTADAGEIVYTASFGAGLEVEDSLWLLGEEYQITDLDDDLELGSQVEHRRLAEGDMVSHGDWEVEIDMVDEDADDMWINVYKDGDFVDDKVVTDDAEDDAEIHYFGDDDEFRVEVTTIFTRDRINIETTLAEIEQDDGEEFWLDDYWTFHTEVDEDVLEEVRLENRYDYIIEEEGEIDEEEERHAIEPGEKIDGPLDYFELENHDLEDIPTEEMSFEEELNIEFTDVNGMEQELDLADDDEWHDVVEGGDEDFTLEEGEDGHIVIKTDDSEGIAVGLEVDDIDEDNGDSTADINFQYGDIDDTYDGMTDGETVFRGFGFRLEIADEGINEGDVQFNLTTGSIGDFLTTDREAEIKAYEYNATDVYDDVTHVEFHEIDEDFAHAEEGGYFIEIAEGMGNGGDDSKHVRVYYDWTDDEENYLDDDLDEGEIAEVWVETPEAQMDDWDDGEETLTKYGSYVRLDGEDLVDFVHPEEQRGLQVSLGEADVTAVDEDYQRIMPVYDAIGKLDTEVVDPADEDHLILVGGPTVNMLVEDLVQDGKLEEVDEEAEEGWDVWSEDTPEIQLVEDAFAEGQTALVVAGMEADDTRAAASRVQDHFAQDTFPDEMTFKL